MSTAGESSPPIFSDENKFDRTNWVAWSKFIHITAQMKGIFGYLDGTIKDPRVLRSKKVDLIYFIFLFIFYFIFDLFLYFLFLEQLGLGLIGHAITSVT